VTTGIHPETEMSRYLTEHGYANTPRLLGEVVRVSTDGVPHTLTVAQSFVRNQDDLRISFELIAAELRSEYVLGYYPANINRNGKFHKIKVQALADVQIQAHDGYYASQE